MENKRQEYGNREVKSTAFMAYFGESKNAAALYDSITGSHDTRPEDIEYETLEGVLFMARKNDLAFLAKRKVLVISEHQSTINENMPLRDVIYYGRTMEKLIPPRVIYRRRMFQIPTPEFYVFYNGKEDYPQEKILYLSDAFLEKDAPVMLEATVKVININTEKGHAILQKCRPLYEYSVFMEHIRKFEEEGNNKGAAIEKAIRKCRQAGIMTEFLDKHSSEVENMLFTQFNLEDAKEVWKEEAFEDGMDASRIEDILELLSDLGTVPEDVRERIKEQRDSERLKRMFKFAAKAESIEEFVEQAFAEDKRRKRYALL